ncbi:transcription factor NAI1-like [Vigna unguiculata]|uniref:transcription factor NAI1-like n=1 Tax=Vigna unguiculata TaxID=3917 RepID=UPI001015E61A|nr:transcription factor NAI1-like [Vigna unguiculata]
MGEPCQKYWFSDMEIQDFDFFNQSHKIESLDDEDQIFEEIMHRPAFSSDSETHSPKVQTKSNYGGSDYTTLTSSKNSNVVMKSNSSNFLFSSQHAPEKPATAPSPPTAYILSFNDSTVVAATCQTYDGKPPYQEGVAAGSGGACLPSKGVSEKHEIEPKANSATRKGRSSGETLDHIMTERKRRRELTERFIALSATIPGLKKIDKATILCEAITYVKRLKERVRELEEQCKRTRVESVSFVHQRSNVICSDDKGTTSGATKSDECYKTNEALPTVEARVFKKDVLIRIHCKIQNGILIKILDYLNTLDLSTTSNSVMPFGSSTLDISIVAQMGEKFNATMNDLVKNLRVVLLQSSEAPQMIKGV